MTAMAPRRPVLRYWGGKWRLAPWVIEHLPAHRVYVEPFAGGASVLMRKGRAPVEILNDLDGEVVNVFEVLRDPDQRRRLEEALRFTPFARAELDRAYEPADDPVESARRVIFRSFAAMHGENCRKGAHAFRGATSHRMRSGKSGAPRPAFQWSRYPHQLAAYGARLEAVVIEQRDALTLIAEADAPHTAIYVDPPYVHETLERRVPSTGYRHTLTDEDHRELARVLNACESMVVVSGHPSTLYDELFEGWQRVRREVVVDRAKPRVECLWLNKAAIRARSASGALPLFAEVAS